MWKCGQRFVYTLYTFCMHQLYTSCTIFVNRKFCNYILDIKFDLHKNIGKSKFGFGNDTKIYVSENLTHYNQRLTWKCRELKIATKVPKVGNIKVVIKKF